jgi:hypothetical protein
MHSGRAGDVSGPVLVGWTGGEPATIIRCPRFHDIHLRVALLEP